MRRPAEYVNISGKIDTQNAGGLGSDYEIVFTNENNKAFTATINGDTYTVKVPKGYLYTASLNNANGYIISSEVNVNVDSAVSFDIEIFNVSLASVTGTISGLTEELIGKLSIIATPVNEALIFSPEFTINADGTYNVMVEPNEVYTLSALGVNDFYLTETSFVTEGEGTINLTFAPKSLYEITIQIGRAHV